MRSQRCIRFASTLFALHRQQLSDAILVALVRDSASYGALTRAAALRLLVSRAPLSVTLGRPFFDRRARVRRAFAV